MVDVPTLPLENGLESFIERYAPQPQYFVLPEFFWVHDLPAQLEKVLAARNLPLDERMDVEIPWVGPRTIMPAQAVWSSADADCLVNQVDQEWTARWVKALADREPSLDGLLLSKPGAPAGRLSP